MSINSFLSFCQMSVHLLAQTKNADWGIHWMSVVENVWRMWEYEIKGLKLAKSALIQSLLLNSENVVVLLILMTSLEKSIENSSFSIDFSKLVIKFSKPQNFQNVPPFNLPYKYWGVWRITYKSSLLKINKIQIDIIKHFCPHKYKKQKIEISRPV